MRKANVSKQLQIKSAKKLKRPLPKLKKKKRRLSKLFLLHNRQKNYLERNRRKLNKRESSPNKL